jgi:hypothetical protein
MQAANDPEISADLLAHEKTYHVFNMLLRWAMAGLATGLTMLTLWFATPAGFWGGLIVGVVVWIAAYYGLVRHEARQPLDPWVMGR